MNPDLLIEDIEYQERVFHLIQETNLIGGTKSRAVYELIQKYNENTFVCVGSGTGMAQVALAYCTRILNKRCVLYLVACPKQGHTELTKQAIRYGAKVIKCDTITNAEKQAKKEKGHLFPFGLDNEEFIETLANKLISAKFLTHNPTQIWLAVGSGTILKTLMRLYPDANFCGVIVGRKIWEDQFLPRDWARLKLYYSSVRFTQDATELPPYKSLANYDAKVWEFVSKYGNSGDYIFNVS